MARWKLVNGLTHCGARKIGYIYIFSLSLKNLFSYSENSHTVVALTPTCEIAASRNLKLT